MDTLDKLKLQQAEILMNLAKAKPENLTRQFSNQALIEIGKNVVENNEDCDFSLLTPKYLAELRSQLKTTRKYQKKSLRDCLECDCEYPLEVIHEMTPRQKVNAWLIWNGIQGFTDDILNIVSAAYDIMLEPDLNR